MDGVNGEGPSMPQYTVVKICGCGLIRLRLVSPHFDHCDDAYCNKETFVPRAGISSLPFTFCGRMQELNSK